MQKLHAIASLPWAKIFRSRRDKLLAAMRKEAPDGVAVFFSAPVYRRNNDVEHEFRQDSDFFYLTGFDEPESALVLDGKKGTFTMFVRPRDPAREIWDGPRAGVEGAKKLFGADEAYPIAEFEKSLPKLFADRSTVFYRVGFERSHDDVVLHAHATLKGRGRSTHASPYRMVDVAAIVHEMRLIKDDAEIAVMKAAAAVTDRAHRSAMRLTKPRMGEHEIEATLLEHFRRGGSERPAYGSIVGSGPNATILHYRLNNRTMKNGELLLIDAGCELGGYASDVTRTFPVNGRFSKEQKAIYNLVLRAQLQCIKRSVPGANIDAIHQVAVRVLTKGLIDLGLLKGTLDKAIKTESYKRFYMHRTSHWLGMDVHDVGNYYSGGKPRKLVPGMVITIEPGIYIAKNDKTVGAEWRGIGIRIEDDILVTRKIPINLTEAIPKTVREVEAACAN